MGLGTHRQLRLAWASIDADAMPARDLTVDHVKRLLNEAKGEHTRPLRCFVPVSGLGALILDRLAPTCARSLHLPAVPKAPHARAHYLTLEQLGRLWRASARLPEPVWRDFARFLIGVPCRRGEAAHMDWSMLTFALRSGVNPAT
jgi:integrase